MALIASASVIVAFGMGLYALETTSDGFAAHDCELAFREEVRDKISGPMSPRARARIPSITHWQGPPRRRTAVMTTAAWTIREALHRLRLLGYEPFMIV